MQRLKKEIDLRYRIMRYKKLMKHFLYNRFEKNNVEIIYTAIEKIKSSRLENTYLDFYHIPSKKSKKQWWR